MRTFEFIAVGLFFALAVWQLVTALLYYERGMQYAYLASTFFSEGVKFFLTGVGIWFVLRAVRLIGHREL